MAGLALIVACSPGDIVWGSTTGGPDMASTTNPNDPGAQSALSCPGDAADPLAAARKQCVASINRYRATLNVPALARWCGQGTCIDGEAKADASSGTAHSAFGACSEGAQDECPGWSGPLATSTDSCLARMWAEGPGTDYAAHGHYLNMSNAAFKMVECGYHEMSNGQFWAIQNFR